MKTYAEALSEERRAFHDLRDAVEQAALQVQRYADITDDPRNGVVEAALHVEAAQIFLRARVAV